MSTFAILLAGGAGERFGRALPKQFSDLSGRSLLAICLERFQRHPGIDGIILVCPAAQLALAGEIAAAGLCTKLKTILAGGKTRQESSAIGVAAVPPGTRNVLIHDVARALVGADVIDRVLAALADSAAVMAVLPETDTVVRVDEDAAVTAVLDRAKLRRVQTPQGFRLEVIGQAHASARAEGFGNAGDDCSLVLRYQLAPVATVAGDPGNIKITYSQDVAIAEALLRDA
ncbi:MAG TPA: 2-C-methyl-D-erythritol 4-phosphate cytidylyltransferase [Candidatus Binatia bacterium]|nr:2-C-methyl-D-erythritol 4-phosphate cytidylyltransferase [Candidatus Binatia bacterium]